VPWLPGGSTETCWPSFFLDSSVRNLSGSWATGAARQKGRWLAQGFEQGHRGIQYASAAAGGATARGAEGRRCRADGIRPADRDRRRNLRVGT
jgi:hypothetical protein